MVDLRPVVADDLDVLCEFFRAPHVAAWWHQDPDPEVVRAEYVECSDATVLLASIEGRPVGMAQWYLWDDSPADRDAYGLPAGTVGFDYLLGRPIDCDRGLGTTLIAALLALVPPMPVWVTPEAANEPSCRVLEKNGFTRVTVKQCVIEDEPWAGPTALYRLVR